MNNSNLEINDIVYLLNKSSNGNVEILEVEIQGIWSDGRVDVDVIGDESAELTFYPSMLSPNTLFHTREEAEKALENLMSKF